MVAKKFVYDRKESDARVAFLNNYLVVLKHKLEKYMCFIKVLTDLLNLS